MKWFLLLCCITVWSKNTPSVAKYPNLLFYIQRNLNQNTVIYEANFDTNGQLSADKPIKVHWIMYEKKGESQALNYIEKKMAYGVKCFPEETTTHQFKVQLAADKTHTFRLKQLAPFKAQVTTIINSIPVQLTRLFIESDNLSLWPKVNYIVIEGKELKTQRIISKQFYPQE